MARIALIDNDIVVKIACFGIFQEFCTNLSVNKLSPYILSVTKYVSRKRVARLSSLRNTQEAQDRLEKFLQNLRFTDPSDEELSAAAELEAAAQRKNLELDTGESQLLAILIIRGLNLLITGDKRAVIAIENVVGESIVSPRIACLEQVFASLLNTDNFNQIRDRICFESATDRAIASCFACNSRSVQIDSVFEGLRSYSKALRNQAKSVLLLTDDLSACIA